MKLCSRMLRPGKAATPKNTNGHLNVVLVALTVPDIQAEMTVVPEERQQPFDGFRGAAREPKKPNGHRYQCR
jgi:hypothetical protein